MDGRTTEVNFQEADKEADSKMDAGRLCGSIAARGGRDGWPGLSVWRYSLLSTSTRHGTRDGAGLGLCVSARTELTCSLRANVAVSRVVCGELGR